MRKNRFNLLFEVYTAAFQNRTLKKGLILDRSDFEKERFDYEYLEDKRYVRIVYLSKNKTEIRITAKGIDVIENTMGKKKIAIEMYKIKEMMGDGEDGEIV